MRTLKKLTAVFTLIILMAALFPTGTKANEFSAPVFLGAEFTKDTFEAGEHITIDVDSQPGTNEMDYVWVQIEHEQTERLFYSNNIPYVDGGTEVTLNLPSGAPTGTYVIQAVSLVDTAGVSTDTFNPGSSFELIGEPTDIEKPVFQYAEFEKQQYEPGEEVVLKIDATDDWSGIEWIYASLQHLSSEDYTFWGFSTEVNGQHEIRFQLPANALNGEYGIQYLTLRDNAGNEQNVFDADATFEVIGGSSDINAPTLKNISIEKEQYKPGESFSINIDAEDESGVESVYLYVKHKQTGIQYNAWAIFNGKTFDFVRELPVNAPLGQYEVFAVYLEDTLGNQVDLFEYKPRIEFEVTE